MDTTVKLGYYDGLSCCSPHPRITKRHISLFRILALKTFLRRCEFLCIKCQKVSPTGGDLAIRSEKGQRCEGKQMTTHILIADSSSLTVVGAETLLKGRADTEITKAENGNDLIAKAEAVHPEIILLGDRFDPLIDTLVLVEKLQRTVPTTRLIIMGLMSDGLLIRDLIAAGAQGYLMVGDDMRVCLPTAVDMALRDRPYLSPTANAEYLTAMRSSLRDWQLDSEARSVLRLLARGMHVSQIAEEMEVPLRRIYWVRKKLRQRFGASTNEHLISTAIREGYAFQTS
jgi:DNA-binding NarL/FixJ family response regulator